MRLILISLFTPTFNNCRAASALPYHLISSVKKSFSASINVYSYNINELDTAQIEQVEKELNIRIHLLDKPKWLKMMMKLHLVFFRVFLKYPLYSYCTLPQKYIKSIKKTRSDIIWIYGEELAGHSKYFEGSKCIVTMPDCESLYYYRMLRQPWATMSLLQIMKYSFAYWQYKSLEKRFCEKDVIYHFVGKEDADFFKSMNGQANSLFMRHPLYAYNSEKTIKFHQPKIKLLFTGRYDFYCQHGSDDFLSELEKNCNGLSSYFEITFLGKGWEMWSEKLHRAGFYSHNICFAPDYIVELQKHDIQVNAIDVGTGTKGKVLDGIANGLLIIGTPYALENISVKNGESCVMVSNGIDFIQSLYAIKKNIFLYEKIAKEGQKKVLLEHNTMAIARNLFGIIN
ncbi:glycosyltransferase family 1 protein [Prevotella sp.]